MPASCVLFCSIPLSELVGRVKPPRVRLHSPAVRASIEGLSPLRRIASQTSAYPARGRAKGKAIGLEEWAGGSRNARQRILFFKSLSPNLGQKFWGVKRNFYLRPQTLYSREKKSRNPVKIAALTNAERGRFEPLRHSFIYAVFRGFILKSEDFLRIFSLLISNSPTLK